MTANSAPPDLTGVLVLDYQYTPLDCTGVLDLDFQCCPLDSNTSSGLSAFSFTFFFFFFFSFSNAMFFSPAGLSGSEIQWLAEKSSQLVKISRRDIPVVLAKVGGIPLKKRTNKTRPVSY